ncbi:shikimate kinase II, partial [Desulfovibrio sp. OttesenSCG-928-G11]|nr:shikimate kinase II [Desulfovibrio sp. OttesenSCG-928-G11]
MSSKPVFLVGPRGCGKSSAGAGAAALLGLPFYDCDAIFEERSELSIAALVRAEGWAKFRLMEAEILRGLAGKSGIVATGGGAVLDEASRALLRASGLTLYLEADPELLRLRLERDPDPDRRPPLAGQGPEGEVEAAPGDRAPLYRAVAHHSVDASRPLCEV